MDNFEFYINEQIETKNKELTRRKNSLKADVTTDVSAVNIMADVTDTLKVEIELKLLKDILSTYKGINM